MPLRKIATQAYKTVQEYYQDLAGSDGSCDRRVGSGMLALIALLDAELPETIWCFTSHDRLVLTPVEEAQMALAVTIECLSESMYNIHYTVPDADAPFPNATMHGFAGNVQTAKEYVLIGMSKSKGWDL